MVAAALGVEAWVRRRCREAARLQLSAQPQVPRPRRLPQAVQGLAQAADHARCALLISRRLLDEHPLLQLTVEERRFDVEVLQLHVACRHLRQKRAQRRVLAHGRVDLGEVDALLLHEALDHETGLVALDVSLGVPLDLVHPLDGQSLGAVG